MAGRTADHRPRLTGGQARGRVLPEPVPESVRPTASRVREALFSIVGQDLAGVRVLDAFAGSGLLGLEAWSRGAAEVVAIERDPAIAEVVRRNARALGASLVVRVGDAVALAPTLGGFELVLVDPPYRVAPAAVVEALAPTVAGVLVLEHDATVAAPEVAPLARERTRVYGAGALTVYRRVEAG